MPTAGLAAGVPTARLQTTSEGLVREALSKILHEFSPLEQVRPNETEWKTLEQLEANQYGIQASKGLFASDRLLGCISYLSSVQLHSWQGYGRIARKTNAYSTWVTNSADRHVQDATLAIDFMSQSFY